jgi:hypothetical protein
MQLKKRKHVVLIIAIVLLIFSACQEVEITERDRLIEEQSARIESNVDEWFGGQEVNYYVGNNRDYNWFIDQGETGEHSNNNCGPSSAVMALHWLDESFSETAEDARNKYLLQGGWWSTNTVQTYFKGHNVDYGFIFFNSDDKESGIIEMKETIEDNSIILLCVDMGYIPVDPRVDMRINRFYDYDDGHFIIVKGYVEVDDDSYFEVYDPNNWGQTYPNDGTPRGKDRYFSADSLMDAIVNWWDIGYVIHDPLDDNANS